MLKRTAIAIFAPLVLAACDPEVSAVEQDLVVAETTTTQTTPYFQPQPLLGQQLAAVPNQPGYGLSNQYGAQIASTALAPNQFASGPSQVGLRTDVGDRVFFTTDSSVLDPRGAVVIDQLGAWMRQYPTIRMRIEGHADERGTRDYNIALGDSRATAIRNRLLQLGVSADRLTTVSYGKERPVASGSNPTAWAQNRRAVFVVL
ncbi:MAG: peptidoglycan-associated lipoprotein [Geminicoccus sp.]|jgi:peptidoglycan-associated lipoprotein|nr:peptidoglycan-associated lipoprotein [Geminicoccus sp.]